jgi:hypothetical protein
MYGMDMVRENVSYVNIPFRFFSLVRAVLSTVSTAEGHMAARTRSTTITAATS